jgi:putative ABC transport system permease protein
MSKENIDYSLKNIWHRKNRSFLTILSIFMGITTIFIFVSFGWGLYDYVNSFASGTSVDKITVQLKGVGAPGLDDTFYLTESDLRAVKKTPGVYDAVGGFMGVAEIEKTDIKKYVMYVGHNHKTEIFNELVSVDILYGRDVSSGEENKVVLGYNYLIEDKIFPRALSLNEKVLINGEEFRIAGFYSELGNPQDDSQIYLSEEGVRRIAPDKAGYNMVVAKADIAQIDAVVKNTERALRNSRNEKEGQETFFVASFTDLIASYVGALGIIIGFVILIALISVLVSAVNTANTMITSVLERTREIGIIKAIGARNKEILSIFLFESAFLGFVAGIIGVMLGWGLTYLGGAVLDNLGWGFLSPHYSFSLFFGCILFSTITGAISGVAPAINASRIRIVDALRYE